MAGPRLAAAAGAWLHDRGARRALRIRRAGSGRARALPDGSRPRDADRNAGGASLNSIIPTSRTLSMFPALREKIAPTAPLIAKNLRNIGYLLSQSDDSRTVWQGGFD